MRTPMLLLAALAAFALAPAGPIGGASSGRAGAAEITGTATYLDRAMLPPGATLTVTLSDVSRQDVAAPVLATWSAPTRGGPPYPFRLAYDPTAIEARNTYAVAARVTLGERLLMITDTANHVLTHGAPSEIDLVMRRVNASADAADTPNALGLRLPASYTGTTPMASGPGLDWHLDLWPDQVFHLRQTYGDGQTADDIGRWHADASRDALVLRGGREAPIFLSVTGNGDLRLMTPQGTPIESDLPYTLAAGPLRPTEVALPMRGMFRYMADAALFEECRTGRSYPVAMEGSYIDAERAYLALDGRAPGAPVLAVLDGRLAERPPMEGPPRPHLVIDRFDRLVPGETCPQDAAAATLTNTYWKLTSLAGAPVAVEDGHREPHLVLRTGETPAFNATVGCNMMRGRYETGEDGTLRFGPAASTLMACPPPLDAAERRLARVLADTASFGIDGEALTLRDADGTAIATARAVYLP